MIAGWLLYCLATSALIVFAAAVVDDILTAHRRPARWVWVVAMLGMLGIPAGAYLLQQRPPQMLPGAADAGAAPIADRFPAWRLDAARGAVTARHRADIRRPQTPEFSSSDRLAVDVAILCIVLAALRVAIDSVLLYKNRRRWESSTVDGTPVLLSDDVGPAIVGLVEPRIVLPRWTLALLPDERGLMLAHEREHVRANDGRLTTIALIAMVCMPWNPAMWWALRRLRTAIEVDCDRRVLRTFPDVTRYGRLLVEVAQRAVGSSMAVAGFSERAAPLARRIRAMTASTTLAAARFTFRDAGSGTLGALALVGSVALLPPQAPARALGTPPRHTPVLPKNVGDSVAAGEQPPTPIAAAADLPAEFSVVSYGSSDTRTPTAGRCAELLRDPRDSTRLQVSMSMTSTLGVVQRGDTAWTNVGATGFYMVTPVGRYGVKENQTLRVGCGSYTRMSVAGHRYTSNASSTLDTPNDDRARRIGQQISTVLRLEPATIELYPGRLRVVIADTIPASPGGEANWEIVHRTFALSRELLGAAMPETLSVSMASTGPAQWVTLYYYKSMAK